MSHQEQLKVLGEIVKRLSEAQKFSRSLTAEHNKVKQRINVALSQARQGEWHEHYCVNTIELTKEEFEQVFKLSCDMHH